MITHHLEDGRLFLAISGELNLNSLPTVRAKAEELGLDTYDHVVIDLSKVTFMDSSGMGFLVVLIKNARARGSSIALQAPNTLIRRMLSAIRMDRFVVITDAEGNQTNQAEMQEQAAESQEAE
jgi:anti-sigma B factor antagonist